MINNQVLPARQPTSTPRHAREVRAVQARTDIRSLQIQEEASLLRDKVRAATQVGEYTLLAHTFLSQVEASAALHYAGDAQDLRRIARDVEAGVQAVFWSGCRRIAEL